MQTGTKFAQQDALFGQNHLTLMRWILAFGVVLGHSWLLTTGSMPIRIHELTTSYMAVNGFFILSGLLIAKSLYTRKDVGAYAVSRILRIYPALIVVLLAFALVIAPVFGNPAGPSQLTSSENWTYVLKVLFLGDPEWAPGGVFANSLEADFNGPLWTIRFELIAYGFAAIAFLTGATKTLGRTFVLFAITQAAYLALPFFIDKADAPGGIVALLRLMPCFLMGMVLWHSRELREPSWLAVFGFVLVFLVFGSTPSGELLANVALMGIVLKLGLPGKPVEAITKIPDYSYGVYIWHYPAMQIVLVAWPELGSWGLVLASTPLFVLLSALSWHYVEKPALGLKGMIIRKNIVA